MMIRCNLCQMEFKKMPFFKKRLKVTDCNNFSVVLGYLCDDCQRAYQKPLDEGLVLWEINPND